MEQGEITTQETGAEDVRPVSAFDFMLAQAATGSIEEHHAEPLGVTALGLVAAPPRTRSAPVDWISLVLAIVIAPIGLLVGIAAAILDHRRVGYTTTLAKSAIIVSIVISLVGGAGGVALGYFAGVQAHESALRSSSAPMCTMIAARAGVLSDPAFGWPALDSTIPAYVDSVAAYEAWWSHLASVAPSGVAPQARAVATAAHGVSARIAASKVIDHDRDYSELRSVASSSTLPKWVATYCP
jgi:hypothetical protein